MDTDGNSYSINADGTLTTKVETTLYVSSSGNDTNSGISEEKALLTLQAAVDKISTADEWTIIVSGTVTGSTTISSISASSLTIKGKTGYSSDILQGGDSASSNDPVLWIADDISVPLTFSDLTMQYGTGAIMHGGSGSLTVENCSIIKNDDSGINISGSADATVKGTTIGGSYENLNACESGNGSGIYKSGNGTLSIDSCEISYNTAGNNGGGIFVSGGTVNISNTTIESNNANTGGGIEIDGGTVNFETGKIDGNSATYGGGVFIYSGTFNFKGGSIEQNSATTGSGVQVYNGAFSISGLAAIDSGNDVFLNSGKCITIGGSISSLSAAKITPQAYTEGTQILQDGDGTVADNYTKFSVTTESSGQAWTVDSSGCLKQQ